MVFTFETFHCNCFIDACYILSNWCHISASDQLKGDLFCLGGAVLYAIGNVAQEYLVKNHSISEYLGLLGVSASIISGVQL